MMPMTNTSITSQPMPPNCSLLLLARLSAEVAATVALDLVSHKKFS